jgi:RNA polymerase sigma factor (sigma-70 family)
MELKIQTFVMHSSFEDPAAEAVILSPMLGEAEYQVLMRKPCPEIPVGFGGLVSLPLLTGEQEQHLFRKMNFLKYKAATFSRQADALLVGTAQTQVKVLLDEALDICNRLVGANLRLVVSILKKFPGTRVGFTDLLSDGATALFRAVQKFDFSRGHKFSTYATWAVKRQLGRSIEEDHQHRQRFEFADVEDFEAEADRMAAVAADVDPATKAAERVEQLLATLEPRERQVLCLRAGLHEGRQPLTLEQVGQRLGVTKGRVRQVEQRAFLKLRQRNQPVAV